MAYERLNLKDFDEDNPFAAKHVSHIEDGIVQNESDITELYNSLADIDAFGTGSAISNGDDLNDYTVVGKYYCNTSAVAGSLLNSPSTASFSLYVLNMIGSANARLQILTRNSTGGSVFYFRMMQSASTIGDWYLISGTAVSTTSATAENSVE